MYLIDKGNKDIPPKEYATVSKGLSDCGVVAITRCVDGRFMVEEQCDLYYSVVLTKEQLRAWALELIAMSEQP